MPGYPKPFMDVRGPAEKVAGVEQGEVDGPQVKGAPLQRSCLIVTAGGMPPVFVGRVPVTERRVDIGEGHAVAVVPPGFRGARFRRGQTVFGLFKGLSG